MTGEELAALLVDDLVSPATVGESMGKTSAWVEPTDICDGDTRSDWFCLTNGEELAVLNVEDLDNPRPVKLLAEGVRNNIGGGSDPTDI